VKRVALLLLVATATQAAPPDSFWRALHLVETGGKRGPILGDNGKALGPLQIHRSYWADARVGGRYEDCADLQYSIRVASAYLRRYAPQAWASGDVTTLARVHNGGPRGNQKPQTLPYAAKVQRNLK
jgi:hypothetical protein